MRRDLFHNINPLPLFLPAAAITDNTPLVSQIIDTQGYESATFVIVTGNDADADATFTFLFEHGDASDMSDHAEVPAALQLGTEALAGYTFADDNKTRKIGYLGGKRYLRATVTPANNTGNVFLGGVAVLGHPHSAPTPNPPA
jgi:hypothetical protein